jgi:hypothetical protein
MAYEDTEDYKNLMKAQEREAKEAAAPKKKERVVTKEQMKKAGFDNLRDYMNAQKGLKRRDGFASEAQKRAFAAAPRGTQTEGAAGEAEAREGMKKPTQADLDRISRKQAEEAKGPSEADIDRMAKKFDTKKDRPGSEVIAEKQEKAQPKMQSAYRESFGNIRKALGFKSGGSVSSASKRADGCAVKGKTRGKMV